MKVTNSTINNTVQGSRPQEADKRSASAATRDARTGSGTDRVELSVSQGRIERLTNKLATMEVNNSEKIEALKQRITEGSYHVSGRAVAEKMLGSIGLSIGGEGE